MCTQLYSRIGLLGLPLLFACSAPKDDQDTNVTGTPMAEPPSVAAPLATPSPIRPTKRLNRPLTTATKGFVMVDRVDVANKPNERAHTYKTAHDRPLRARTFDLGPRKGIFSDEGRATNTYESFQVKVHPQQDHLLIRAIDPTSNGRILRVFLDGKPAGDWKFPAIEAGEYGEASFPIKGSTIGDRSKIDIRLESASDTAEVNSYVYWVYGKPDRKLVEPLITKTDTLTLTDRIDVGAKADEEAHRYAIEKPTYQATIEYKWPTANAAFLEDSRATKSSESFRMKVVPGKDHVLVKAFDNSVKDQVVRVLVDGTVAGDWKLPTEKARYGEAAFQIPAKLIGTKPEVGIQIQFVSSSKDTNSLYYWLYSQPTRSSG